MRLIRRGIAGFNTEKVTRLIREYPYKRFQQETQKIDRELLANFHANQLRERIERKAGIYWEVVDQDNLLAVCAIDYLQEHSEVYGRKMFRISTLINYKEPGQCFKLIWDALQYHIRHQSIDHLSCRIDASDYQNMAHLTLVGFRSCGISLKMTSSEAKLRVDGRYAQEVIVAKATRDDMERVAFITREHVFNHYFYDASLPVDKTKDLFANWASSLVKGNDLVYVLVEQERNEIIGFISYQDPHGFNRALGTKILSLDTIVIQGIYRGKRYGEVLIQETLLDKFSRYNQIELRVSHDNYRAINFYQKFGFRIVSADMWLAYHSPK